MSDRERLSYLAERIKSNTRTLPISRVVEELVTGLPSLFGALPAGPLRSFTPPMDVVERLSEIVVAIELPGMSEQDVEVSLSEEGLTIRGEKKAIVHAPAERHLYDERKFGPFERFVPLGPDVQEDQISAEFDRGVLTISVPKVARPSQGTRRVEIKGSSSQSGTIKPKGVRSDEPPSSK